jgi:hypothetical protein
VVIDQRVNQSVAVSASTEHTFSFFAKKGTTTTPRYSVYDLSNNAFILTQVDYSSLVNTSTWSRITATFTTPAGCTLVSIYPINAASLGTTFIWGCQLETGVATDYIATTTAAVSVGPVSGLPRLDYLGSTCPKLLLEPQRTNLFLYSEQFDNAYWTKGNATISANTSATLDPSGYNGSDKLQEDNTNNSHYFGSDTASALSGEVVTYSIFLKAAERSFAALRLYSGSSSVLGYYNLANGTLGTIGGGGTGTIVSYGNGWYRCSLTITMASSSVTLPYVFTSTGNGVNSYTGTTGSGIYCFGAQQEIASYATSYIPTLGASVTRVADAASKTGITSLIGQTEGTLFLDFNLQTTNEDFVIGQIYNSSTPANSIYFYLNSTNFLQALVDNSGSQVNLFSPTALAQGNYKVAIAYKANDFVYYINGVQIATDTSGTVPTCNSVNLIDYVGVPTYMEKAAVNQYLLFKTRLTNAQLAELTA